MSLDEYDFGSTVQHHFHTNDAAGASVQASSLGLTVYRGGSTVPSASGLTLTLDYNNTTGLHFFSIDMSTTGIYSSAGTFSAVVSSGTVDGQVVTGQRVYSWRILSIDEPSPGPPPTPLTPRTAMSYLYHALRHQIRVGASNKTFFDSSENVLWTKGLLDDGTTYVELAGTTST